MDSEEKRIAYQTTNSYSVLNSLSDKTKNVWVVCHGMGYLSRYFLKYFSRLNSEENYIIAPQAPSKYYLSNNFRRIGSSWLTKENTIEETQNILNYLDAVFLAEKLPSHHNLILMGYSQGVSIALRYLAKKQLKCSKVLIMSGGIPKELTSLDFQFLNPQTKIFLTYGNEDAYLDENRTLEECEKATKLFGHCQLEIIPFEGKHEVNTALLMAIA